MNTERPRNLELDSKNRFKIDYCPCGKSNKDGKFVPYRGYENNGYCHACIKCFPPEIEQTEHPVKVKYNYKSKSISFIKNDKLIDSLNNYDENNFVRFLISVFGNKVAGELITRYFIGTSNYWTGATIFWQIDLNGKIRTGKIMQYNPVKGNRIKEPINKISWVHKNINEFNLKQCLFGEHLIKEKGSENKIIAIFESEKTAIISSVFFPGFICMSVGGKEGLKAEKLSVLKGRRIILYPDIEAFDKWSEIARDFSQFAKITVSNKLEKYADENEKSQKLDIADYIINSIKSESISQIKEPEIIERTVRQYSENWSNEITELEKYFNSISLSNSPVKINEYTNILNPHTFVESHLNTLKTNNGNEKYYPFLIRLNQFAEQMKLT
jgi:hypothetical protein